MRHSILFFILSASLFNPILNTELSAQPISPIHQANLSDFMDDLDDYYGSLIEIPLPSIENYLSPLLPPNGFNLCPGPDLEPEATLITDTLIRFDWNAVPAASSYRVGYVNLKTGANAIFQTTNLQYSFNVPNGFYLFFFQSKCGNVYGDAEDIIIEKVVQLSVDSSLSCECTYGIENELDLIEVPDFQVLDEFDLIIKHQTGEEVLRAHLKKQEGSESPIFYDINPNCGRRKIEVKHNILYCQAGTIMFDMDAGNLILDISELDSTYDVKIGICRGAEFNPKPSKITYSKTNTNIFPNPFSDYLDINFNSDFDENKSVSIFNSNGVQVYYNSNIAPHENHPINTSIFPSGIYIVAVQSAGTKQYYKVIKAE